MAYENLCMYCFKDMGGEAVCPHCGRDSRAAVPQIQMLPGSLVYHDRFLVGRALGQDAGGIVYTAMDTKRGGVIRIREYLPRNCAERLNDGAVVPIAGMEDAFEAGMKKLRASVESVEDPKKRHFYFEENGTAYIAQRKNAASGGGAAEDADEDEGDRKRQIVLYVAIAAAVVLAVAIGLIWFLNSMGDADDVTLDNPLTSASPGATWLPAETPTPTPYATATFAALVDPELSWMDYTYSGDVESEYQQQTNAAATKKPTVNTDTDYSTVSGSSSSASVKNLQQRLYELGWLSGSNITGKYDSATKQAVKDFQTYVNNYCSPAVKLAVDGIAGEKTQQWLYNASVSLTRPTPTPQPPVTAAPDDGTVDAGSSAAEIRAVQNKLIALGLLPAGGADGKYGTSTATAVKNFQIRVNQLQGYAALEITGTVDPQTMAYLNYYVEWWQEQQQATATPSAPAATATPAPGKTQSPATGTIDASSPKAEIASVQEMLSKVGLLKASDVDGVYGKGTIAAVKTFQSWVNAQRGEETLAVSGSCDALTQAYLKYCVENNRVVAMPTDAPTQAPTAAPTQAPTEAPEPTEVPPEQQAGDGVGPDSPVESISFVQEMLADVGLLDASAIDGSYGEQTKAAVRALQQFINDQQGQTVLEVTGICDRKTLEALQYCYDRGWNLTDAGDEPEPTDVPPEQDNTGSSITPESSRESISFMQEMLADVGLLDMSQVDGSYGEATKAAVRALQQFVNDQKGETVLEVTGICDVLTTRYLQYCYDQGWNLTDSGDTPDETAAPEPTAEPTPEPTAEPTPEPTAEPTRPAVATVEGFRVALNGQAADGGVAELEPGQYDVTWSADGGVASYYLYLFDSAHNLLRSAEQTSQTSFRMDTSVMNPGEVYELRIGALPQNGTEDDILWQSLQFMCAAQATPEPTEAPTPEPTQRPGVSAPAINIGSSVYQSDGVTYINDSTIIFSWMSSGEVESYNVYLLSADGNKYSLGQTSNTSKTVKRDQLQPGLYKLYVGATPVGGGEDDTVWSELLFGVPAPEATETPVEAIEAPDAGVSRIPEYLDASSSSEDIRNVQMALYKYGLLNTDGLEDGVLDARTLEAVAAFQLRANESLDAGLMVIDPEYDAYIDGATLRLLLDPSTALG